MTGDEHQRVPVSIEEHPSLQRLWLVGGGLATVLTAWLVWVSLKVLEVDKAVAVSLTEINGNLEQMIESDSRTAADAVKATAATEKWQGETKTDLRSFVIEKVAGEREERARELAALRELCSTCRR